MPSTGMVPVREYGLGDLAAQRAHARLLRERMLNPVRIVRPRVEPPAAVEINPSIESIAAEPVAEPVEPALCKPLMSGSPAGQAVIIRDFVATLGITYWDAVGPSKERRFAYARMLAMAHLKEVLPSISLPSLGMAFGGRDHTTALHALRQVQGNEEAMRAYIAKANEAYRPAQGVTGPPVTAAERERIRSLVRRGFSTTRVCAETGRGEETVRRHTRDIRDARRAALRARRLAERGKTITTDAS